MVSCIACENVLKTFSQTLCHNQLKQQSAQIARWVYQWRWRQLGKTMSCSQDLRCYRQPHSQTYTKNMCINGIENIHGFYFLLHCDCVFYILCNGLLTITLLCYTLSGKLYVVLYAHWYVLLLVCLCHALLVISMHCGLLGGEFSELSMF